MSIIRVAAVLFANFSVLVDSLPLADLVRGPQGSLRWNLNSTDADVTPSFCLATPTSVGESYSLYSQGDPSKEAASGGMKYPGRIKETNGFPFTDHAATPEEIGWSACFSRADGGGNQPRALADSGSAFSSTHLPHIGGVGNHQEEHDIWYPTATGKDATITTAQSSSLGMS